MLAADNVHVAALLRRCGREVEQVDEEAVLADRFRAPSPLDELELGDPPIGHQVVFASGVACAERDGLDPLVPLQDVRWRDEDPDAWMTTWICPASSLMVSAPRK